MLSQLRILDHGQNGGCDETKCVSKGGSNLFNGSFTCYSDGGTFYPKMCADGFVPIIAEDEPPFVTTDMNERGDISLSYFTCCPPQYPSLETSQAIRQCSDPITVPTQFEPTKNTNSICAYPRKMKAGADHSENNFIVCCDSYTNESIKDYDHKTTSDFLSDAECVPYRNQYYEVPRVENEFAKISVISCDFPRGDFGFPRPVDGNASITGHYQCCKTGPALPPFVKDSIFKATIYPVITLFIVAGILSLIVIVGLLVPLVTQLIKGSYQQQATLRNSSSMRNSISSRISVGDPRYSTYNLYLVYLALFDFTYSLLHISMYGNTMNQKFYPGFYGPLVCSPLLDHFPPKPEIQAIYVGANMWINAIISYQILALLRTSKRLKRINQPSLRAVNLQALTVYVFTIISGYSLSLIDDAIQYEENCNRCLRIVFFCWLGLLYVPPLLYVIYVAMVIWKRGLLPSKHRATCTKRRTRELAFFFFRIVIVFIGVWFPVLMCTGYGHSTKNSLGFFLSSCLEAIQPILTTCMILTKSDARKYIFDLVTFSYCRKMDRRGENSGAMMKEGRSSEMNISFEEPSALISTRNLAQSRGRRSFFVKNSVETDEEEIIFDAVLYDPKLDIDIGAESSQIDEEESGGGDTFIRDPKSDVDISAKSSQIDEEEIIFDTVLRDPKSYVDISAKSSKIDDAESGGGMSYSSDEEEVEEEELQQSDRRLQQSRKSDLQCNRALPFLFLASSPIPLERLSRSPSPLLDGEECPHSSSFPQLSIDGDTFAENTEGTTM